MNKILHKKNTINKVSAILLLLVFALGVTPKQTLHDLFANHKDSTAKITDSKIPQLTKAGFNCQCDDLVAESHFISASPFHIINIPGIYFYSSAGISSFISTSLFFFNLRGPPSILIA